MERMNTAEAVVESLLRHGIDTLYVLPGIQNDVLLDAAHKAAPRLRVLHTRHEQTAGYMALGAALATGRPQAFAVVPGPGLLNAAAAMLTAEALGAPVLALVGQIPQFAVDHGFGYLHEIRDQLGLMRHIAKHAERIRGPAEAPARVAEAIRIARSGRQGPVALECSVDIWGLGSPVHFPEIQPPRNPPLDAVALARAATLLRAARRPLIFVGGGARNAAPELRAVAEALEAPVVSYRGGRGILPTDHRLAVPLPIGHRLWKDADAVLAVGTRFFWPQSNWGIDDRLKIVRIDIDPEEPDRWRHPDCALISDAAESLAALAPLLAATPPRPSRDAELAPHRAWFAARMADLEPQNGFLHALRRALPANGILVEDVTQVSFANRLAYPVADPRSYFSGGYMDNLGWAYGAALGAQAAAPNRPVLCIAGDGGFMYQAAELATAKHHNLPVVVVVFDDGAFGNVRRIQAKAYGNRLIASDLTNPDFVAFASSFGLPAFRARTAPELEAAVIAAFATGEPALVHVPVGEMPSPWDMILLPRIHAGDGATRPNWP